MRPLKLFNEWALFGRDPSRVFTGSKRCQLSNALRSRHIYVPWQQHEDVGCSLHSIFFLRFLESNFSHHFSFYLLVKRNWFKTYFQSKMLTSEAAPLMMKTYWEMGQWLDSKLQDNMVTKLRHYYGKESWIKMSVTVLLNTSAYTWRAANSHHRPSTSGG